MLDQTETCSPNNQGQEDMEMGSYFLFLCESKPLKSELVWSSATSHLVDLLSGSPSGQEGKVPLSSGCRGFYVAWRVGRGLMQSGVRDRETKKGRGTIISKIISNH